MKKIIQSQIQLQVQSQGYAEVKTAGSGICHIIPPGQLVCPDAEPGDPGYGETSKGWIFWPEGSGQSTEYPSLDELIDAESHDFISPEKEKRFTITIDDQLWHQVGIRAAELRITKRAFLEEALREKLGKPSF